MTTETNDFNRSPILAALVAKARAAYDAKLKEVMTDAGRAECKRWNRVCKKSCQKSESGK